MPASSDRILTTTVGSLPRPPEVITLLRGRPPGQPFDEQEREILRQRTAEAVRLQAECGIDIPSDGEFSKAGFANYANDRLTGFESRPGARGNRSRDRARFAAAYAEIEGTATGSRDGRLDVVCAGPIIYRGQELLAFDLGNFRSALEGLDVADAFVPSIAPGTFELQRRNEYYSSLEEYLYAIADAMKEEYRAIIDAGYILQLDDPRLMTEFDSTDPEPSRDEYRDMVALRVEALNHALEGLPEERIRYHICWGSWHGPHTTDLPLGDVVDILLRIRAGAFSIEAANPRHEHEYHVWEHVRFPDGKVLIPGVIAHTTNCVEHPEVVAERIMRFANLVGREHVIAGVDCGFAQGAATQRVHPEIVWEKLRSLAAGAELASQRLK